MSTNELYHHGVLGQKWGIRRFQNPDGTLTEAGKKRYQQGNLAKNYQNRLNDLDTAMSRHKKDAIKSLARHDKLVRRKSESMPDRIKESLKDPFWENSPITKSGIEREVNKEWSKLQNASKMVELGQKETKEILRKMVKNNMYISSKKVAKAKVKGEKYYNTVMKNAPESSEYKLTYDENSGKYRVEVMGDKYKVSEYKKPGYKHPSEL